jgi:hypothetical protein
MKRSPFKLRADGKPKDLAVHRRIVDAYGWYAATDPDGGVGWPPSTTSAERTRSKRALAGSRRTRKCARAAR